MVSSPVWRQPPTAASVDAGASLLDALSAFQTVPDPDPTERKARNASFLKAARVRSWRALQHESRSCWIVETDGVVAFTPLRNGGSKGAALLLDLNTSE